MYLGNSLCMKTLTVRNDALAAQSETTGSLNCVIFQRVTSRFLGHEQLQSFSKLILRLSLTGKCDFARFLSFSHVKLKAGSNLQKL